MDFGVGFYTTSSKEQAMRWAKTKSTAISKPSFVSVYDFDIEYAEQNLVVLSFDSANLNWLQFVVNNRNGIPHNNQHDLSKGPVADDNVYKKL